MMIPYPSLIYSCSPSTFLIPHPSNCRACGDVGIPLPLRRGAWIHTPRNNRCTSRYNPPVGRNIIRVMDIMEGGGGLLSIDRTVSSIKKVVLDSERNGVLFPCIGCTNLNSEGIIECHHQYTITPHTYTHTYTHTLWPHNSRVHIYPPVHLCKSDQCPVGFVSEGGGNTTVNGSLNSG